MSTDGSYAEFVDHRVESKAHSLAVDPSTAISASSVVSMGQAYIAAHLAATIQLAPGEGLVPLHVAFRTDGGQDVATMTVASAISASRVVFGRTSGGGPVGGGGSTVALTFVNDGSLESFRYDWPSYSQLPAQSVEPVGTLLSRLQEVIAARSSVTAPTTPVSVPTSRSAPYPVAVTPDTVLQKFECGYYDPGTKRRNAASPVQAGCVYHSLWQNGVMRRGFSGAVPGEVTVKADSSWIEAAIIRGDPTTSPVAPWKRAARNWGPPGEERPRRSAWRRANDHLSGTW